MLVIFFLIKWVEGIRIDLTKWSYWIIGLEFKKTTFFIFKNNFINIIYLSEKRRYYQNIKSTDYSYWKKEFFSIQIKVSANSIMIELKKESLYGSMICFT